MVMYLSHLTRVQSFEIKANYCYTRFPQNITKADLSLYCEYVVSSVRLTEL